jgi:choline dehydrogenase
LTYVTAPNSPQAIDPKVIQASRELGGEFKYNIDINSGDELGIGALSGYVALQISD